MTKKEPRIICRNCGCNVTRWLDGWKHARGWHSKPSCGGKPAPVKNPKHKE